MSNVLMRDMSQYEPIRKALPPKLSHALAVHNRDMNVIPLTPGTKLPYVKWKQYQTEQIEQEQVEQWWNKWPDADIAIVIPPDLVVVDCDTAEAAAMALKKLPLTPWQVETSRGLHLYFSVPAGTVYKGTRNDMAEIDIKTNGGIIVAPGSIHKSGKVYRWLDPDKAAEPARFVNDLPELTQAMYDDILQWGNEQQDNVSCINLRDYRAQGEAALPPPPVAEGSRDNDLTRYAGGLFRKGLNDAQVMALLSVANDKFTPPLPTEDLLRIVSSIGGIHAKNHPPAPITVKTIVTDGWPEPECLGSNSEQQPYPIDALPPIMRDAVLEIAENVQVPIPVAAGSVLSTCAAAAQSQADVQRDIDLVGPCSLFFLTVFDSGEGKSTVDNKSARVIKNYQKAVARELGSVIAEERAELKLWQSQMSGLESRVKAAASGDPEKLERLKAEYHALAKVKPQVQRLPDMMVEDVTTEGLQRHMAIKWPSVLLNSDEAGVLLGGQAMNADNLMKFLGVVNKGYDGKEQKSSRKQVEEHTVPDTARLSLHLMVQPEVLQKSLEKSGAMWEGIGFLPRCLIQESPIIELRPFRKSTGTAKLDQLHSHIDRVLHLGLPVDEHGNTKPSMMALEPEAQVMWQDFHTRINGETFRAKPGTGEPGKYADVRKYAARCSDNAVRLATVCSIVRAGTTSGGISADDMRMGMAVSEWHLTEAVRFIGKYSTDPATAAAMKLEKWLIDQL